MKKYLALFLSFVFILSLTACAKSGTQNETTPKRETYTVPDNCTYITSDGTEIQSGEIIPSAPALGDKLVTADYTYMYNRRYDGTLGVFCDYGNGGWGVGVNDLNKTSYSELLSFINGEPLTSMHCTFEGCSNLTAAPEIPESVTTLFCCFESCKSLKVAPSIPKGVTDLFFAFKDCRSLELAPAIPEGVTDMQYTFYGCTSLKYAPAIPSTVATMNFTFYNCESLVSAPVIPSSVTDIDHLFAWCDSLTGEVRINATLPSDYVDCGGAAWCCEDEGIPCQSCAYCSTYAKCLSGTKQAITLTGSCNLLHKIATTSEKNNVTIKYSE